MSSARSLAGEVAIPVSDWNDQIIEEFRANAGAVGGMFQGASLILLTTTGSRTGAPRTNPVTYLRDGGRVVVFASNQGASTNPDWYRNLVAHPEVTVEIGAETYGAVAQSLRGSERDRLYARQAELVPAFAQYQAGTTRVIPVVALYRRDPAQLRALGDELVGIHAVLRKELAALVDDLLAGGTPGGKQSAASLGDQLRRRCLTFCDSVHEHHTKESGRGFALLEQRYPGLAPILKQLRAEHEVLAGIQAELRRTLATAGSAPAEVVRAELRRLASTLEEHFDREEEQLVTALNAL
jgi:deazaflavin-dependent oxidoreductase (nitroreductase family)